jgi:choice-of-anchor B domain-containing protein
MRKYLYIFIFIQIFFSPAFAQKNISRVGAWYANGQALSGCWHYADSGGHEYALVGAIDGIIILDISNPAAPEFLFQLPGLSSHWHEVKVSGNYAYAVSEAIDADTLMDGLQIINLSYLPDSAPNYFWHSDGVMTDKLRQAHSITVDENYIYINGHSVPNHGHGVFILEKSDPWHPTYAGEESTRYCHDSFVRGDTLWTSDIQDGMFSVYDITSRANPILLATQQTPYLFNHNAWLSDDSRYIYTTDERNGAPIGSFDVSDLSNITLVDEYYTINMQPAESHNVRVLNDFIINASYGSQVTVIDAKHPDNLIEVGNYPTGAGLCWDADPFLPSGIIIATDTYSDSVYLLRANYIRACYLEGEVTDWITGNTINNAKVDIVSAALHDSTNLSGQYKTGLADAGLYSVIFSKAGYYSRSLSARLINGEMTILNAQLIDSATVLADTGSDAIRMENNPASDIAVLNISHSLLLKNTALKFILTDITGKIVIGEKVIGDEKFLIRKGQLAAGMYFYTVTAGNEIRAKGKLIFE